MTMQCSSGTLIPLAKKRDNAGTLPVDVDVTSIIS
jgi:hypothetical protein